LLMSAVTTLGCMAKHEAEEISINTCPHIYPFHQFETKVGGGLGRGWRKQPARASERGVVMPSNIAQLGSITLERCRVEQVKYTQKFQP